MRGSETDSADLLLSHEPPVSVSVSPGEMLRLLVKQQVHAASGDTLGLIDRLISDYEEDVSPFREHERHRSGEMLRLLVKQRLQAASEHTLGLIDRFTADYEEEVSRLRENERRHKLLEAVFNPRVQLHRSASASQHWFLRTVLRTDRAPSTSWMWSHRTPRHNSQPTCDSCTSSSSLYIQTVCCPGSSLVERAPH
ncbi:uncharacterized protein LOC130198226 isoform X2 [Pseudoliparis swirei]|uniref:uncharacterized protein LOC130198226 isoform X2 n=1 Tax=Pseudoliparis swirei TaxID=2059687 RepID=UPI0024BEA400|nr:uncharacterized protein LOC130198226 isoform X2 [Pseudoliparis swirei]